MAILSSHDDRDNAMRALNNAALAKNELLAGNTAEALRHIEWALSWSFPLLGKEHPMTAVVSHVLRPPLLNHDDETKS